MTIRIQTYNLNGQLREYKKALQNSLRSEK